MKHITTLICMAFGCMVIHTTATAQTISIAMVQTSAWYDTATLKVILVGQYPAQVHFVTNTPAFQLDTTLYGQDSVELVLRNLPLELNEWVQITATDPTGSFSSGTILHTKRAESMNPQVYSEQGDACDSILSFHGGYFCKELPSRFRWEIRGNGVTAVYFWQSPFEYRYPAEDVDADGSYDLSSILAEGWYEARLVTQNQFRNDTSDWYPFYVQRHFLTGVPGILSDKSRVWVAGNSLMIQGLLSATMPVTVYDLHGRVLIETACQGQAGVNFAEVPQGVYLVKIGSQTTKIVK